MEPRIEQLLDEEIVLRVQSGDTESFGVLVERYEKKLLRYGRKFLSDRADVEDMVQDVFVRAYQNIKGFQKGGRFSPWIYRIAHNAFVNQLKKKSRQPFSFVDFDTVLSHPVYDDPAPREREAQEIKKMLDRGLEELAPKYREALVLHYIEDFSYKEIADVLEIPIGTVGVRVKRGRDALEKLVKNNLQEYGA